MYGLEEEEVILLAQDAETYGFHHLLLSENGCDVYGVLDGKELLLLLLKFWIKWWSTVTVWM